MKYSKSEQKSRQTKRQMFYLKLCCRVYSKYLLRPENLASVSIKVCELVLDSFWQEVTLYC